MTNPVLALIPSGYKTNKVYSVLPVNGDGDFTFSRTGDGTRIKENGLIETISGNNNPRLNWVGECPSLLLEGTSTNLQIRSEEFDNASWLKTNITVTANDTISPDGTENADKLQRTSTAASYIYNAITIGYGAKTYTNSIFVKKGEGSFLAIRARGSGSWVDLRFNFSTKQIISYTETSTFTAISSKVEEFNNGWFRIYFTYTTDGYNSITHSYSPRFTEGDIDDTDTNNIANCFIWGSQVEHQLYGSSYIKTEASTVSRALDICKNGGDAELFDIKEGTFFIDVTPFKAGTNHRITLSNNTTNEEIIFYFLSNNTSVTVISEHSGSTQFSHSENITFDTKNKLAFTFKNNEFKLYVNGNLVYTDTSGNIPTGLNSLHFAGNNGGFDYFQGKVHDTRVYNRILTETEAKELTTI